MAIGRSGSRALARVAATAVLGAALGISGCSGELGDEGEEARSEEDVEEAELAQDGALAEGKYLFDQETFGGNGRTCVMCHSRSTGTLNPEQVQEIFEEDPENPLFLLDGSDDGQGNGTTRILSDATIRVRLKLPPNVSVANDPTARAIIVRRTIAPTLNNPALDPLVMVDGRAPSLHAQAFGAIRGHAQAQTNPTQEQIDHIVAFETTARRFFSSTALQKYALGSGPAPKLPKGHSRAQKRGKEWFEGAPPGPTLTSSSHQGVCALCHSGPMLNETNAALETLAVPFAVLGGAPVPPGSRFQSVLVSELNWANNPVFPFVIQSSDGTTVTLESPDPGRALIANTWEPSPVEPSPVGSNPRVRALFKTPSLWGVKKTAPYFHDNSAATLGEAIDQHAAFLELMTNENADGDEALIITPQDKADLVAYLRLL